MIVNTSIPYGSNLLEQNIKELVSQYPFLETFPIGYSVLGKPISCIRFGNGPKEVFYAGAFHANEWITSTLLMKFVEDMCVAYSQNSTIFNYNIRTIFNSVSIFIVPMVNPDGVDLVNGFLDENSTAFIRGKSLASKFPSIPFPSGWKANINGVDLENLQPVRKAL